jgi:hypothetical protein
MDDWLCERAIETKPYRTLQGADRLDRSRASRSAWAVALLAEPFSVVLTTKETVSAGVTALKGKKIQQIWANAPGQLPLALEFSRC